MIAASDAPPLVRAGSTAPARRLLDPLRERVRCLHDSIRTGEACVHGVRAFVRFHGLRHPKEMGADQVRAFLSWLDALVRPRRKPRLPVVLITAEGRAVRSPLDALQPA